jgi:hypothetical protein
MGCGTAHGWKFAGRQGLTPADALGVPCDDPFRIACGCGESRWVRCGTSRASRCKPCSAAYRGRVGRVAGSGLVLGRAGLFVTLTAPGGAAHRLPDGRRCACTPPGGIDLAAWNAGAGKRWNEFVKALRREYGELEYFKAAEVQRRGALHFHVLIRAPRGAGVLVVSQRRVRELAMAYGFGHAVDVQPVQPSHAGYVAKYVAKSADDRGSVPWRGWRHQTKTTRSVDVTTGELSSGETRRLVPSWAPTFRTWSASRRWGTSMRAVRAAQVHYAAVVAVLPSWSDRAPSPGWAMLAGLPTNEADPGTAARAPVG